MWGPREFPCEVASDSDEAARDPQHDTLEPFGMASGRSGSGWHPDTEHCSYTVARSCFFSHHLFSLTVARLLFTEPVKLQFLAPPAPVLTRYSVNSIGAEASGSPTKQVLRTYLVGAPGVLLFHRSQEAGAAKRSSASVRPSDSCSSIRYEKRSSSVWLLWLRYWP